MSIQRQATPYRAHARQEMIVSDVVCTLIAQPEVCIGPFTCRCIAVAGDARSCIIFEYRCLAYQHHYSMCLAQHGHKFTTRADTNKISAIFSSRKISNPRRPAEPATHLRIGGMQLSSLTQVLFAICHSCPELQTRKKANRLYGEDVIIPATWTK